MAISLHKLLELMVKHGSTDLHIVAGAPPMGRVNAKLIPLESRPLSVNETKDICYSVLKDKQKHDFEENKEIDFAFGLENIGRFRANVYMQSDSVAAAFRILEPVIKNIKELGLPPVVSSLVKRPKGLILVTGPTGSGKSTTMASMIKQITEEFQKHIITIEDPVEYVFRHGNSLISQREVNRDTKSFHNALRSSLREDPDVVMIGELRDLETMRAAMSIAETGHLAFGTLHTNTAVQTVNRIIDVFPADEQSQIRGQLSLVLEGVLCQSLLPKIGGGLVLAVEVLIPNNAVRNLIREDKVHQIYGQQQLGQQETKMQTLNQSLANLCAKGLISYEDAKSHSHDTMELQDLLMRYKGTLKQKSGS